MVIEQSNGDLSGIIEYTLKRWGVEQTRRYRNLLYQGFDLLAKSPGIGHPCDKIRKGYRRMEHGKHVVIYRVDSETIFISRILHQDMLPRKHVIE